MVLGVCKGAPVRDLRYRLCQPIDEPDLPGQDLRSPLQIKPPGTVDLRGGLAPAAPGRPLELEGVAR